MLHRNRSAHKQKRPGLGTAPQPCKLFVEPTTRCNLRCSMCVQQSQEHAIAEGDLSPETFEALQPALPRLDAPVLTGIGEPLPRPGLENLIARIRTAMPGHGEIGIQASVPLPVARMLLIPLRAQEEDRAAELRRPLALRHHRDLEEPRLRNLPEQGAGVRPPLLLKL